MRARPDIDRRIFLTCIAGASQVFAPSAGAQDSLDARVRQIERDFIEAFGESAALEEFDHPSKALRTMGLGPEAVFINTFYAACMNIKSDKPPSRPKRPSALMLSLITMLPGGWELLTMRARAAQLKMVAESDDNYDRSAKMGLATAKKLLEMFGEPGEAQAFDALSPLQQTAKLFEVEGKILEGQEVPSPYALYLCGSGSRANRGEFAMKFVTGAFGENDTRVTTWSRMGNGAKYQAVQDAMKKFFADGAIALRGSEENLENFQARFVEKGKVVPPTDQLILMAFGKDARARYRSSSDQPASQELRRAALVTYLGWAYMFFTLLGVQRDPNPAARPATVQEPSPVQPERAMTPADESRLRQILGNQAYDGLTPQDRQNVFLALKDAESAVAGREIPPSLIKIQVEGPVKAAWVKTLDFSPEQVFGREKGAKLNAEVRAAKIARFKELMAQYMGTGMTFEQGLKMGRTAIQFEIGRGK